MPKSLLEFVFPKGLDITKGVTWAPNYRNSQGDRTNPISAPSKNRRGIFLAAGAARNRRHHSATLKILPTKYPPRKSPNFLGPGFSCMPQQNGYVCM